MIFCHLEFSEDYNETTATTKKTLLIQEEKMNVEIMTRMMSEKETALHFLSGTKTGRQSSPKPTM